MLKCNFDENMSFSEAINAALDILGHVKSATPVGFEFNGIEFLLVAKHDNIVTPRVHCMENGLSDITDEAICYQYFSRMVKSEEFRREAEKHLVANIESIAKIMLDS